MKITDDYLIIEPDDKIKETKIFSSKYPTLLGANDFQKPGDVMLEMWGLVEKDPFDPFYRLRGEIAEKRIESILKRKDVAYKYYGCDASNDKIFDLFTNNQFFGGVYDFVISMNGKLMNYEIKSTNIKNMAYMNEPRKEHVKQAELMTYLGNLQKCSIIYVFFDDESEEEIKKWVNEPKIEHDIDMLNVKYKHFEIPIDKEKIKIEMLKAYDLVNECKKNRRIPLAMISDKTLEKLGFKKKINIFEQQEIKI